MVRKTLSCPRFTSTKSISGGSIAKSSVRKLKLPPGPGNRLKKTAKQFWRSTGGIFEAFIKRQIKNTWWECKGFYFQHHFETAVTRGLCCTPHCLPLSFHVWVGECHFSKVCWACNSNELVHISSFPRTQEGFFKDLDGQSFLRKTLTFKRWKWMLCLHLTNCCQKQLIPTTRQGFLLFHWISFQLRDRVTWENL